MTVELSVASVAALISAPLVGFGALVVRMLGRSSRLHLTLETLKRTKADLLVIAFYDLAGAAVATFGLIVFGLSKPAPLVDYFHSDPWIAWMAFGALGPLFAAGLLDKVPLGKLIDLPRDRPVKKVEAVPASSSPRQDAMKHVLYCHWEDIRVVKGKERHDLLHRAKRLLSQGTLHFDDVAEQITAYASEFEEGRLPEEITEVLARRATWPTDHDPFHAGLGLVTLALREGLTRPVSAACRIPENGTTKKTRDAAV